MQILALGIIFQYCGKNAQHEIYPLSNLFSV